MQGVGYVSLDRLFALSIVSNFNLAYLVFVLAFLNKAIQTLRNAWIVNPCHTAFVLVLPNLFPNMQTDSFFKEFPNLWQQFNDLLPIDNILTLHLWSSYKPFTEHRDPGEVIDMPISFRIKLYDENPEETLYFFDNPTQPHVYGEDTMVPTAPNTNSWVWNNLRVKHGSVYNSEYKKILVIATGVINAERYEELMDTSISTYKDHCVLSKYSLENYVDV